MRLLQTAAAASDEIGAVMVLEHCETAHNHSVLSTSVKGSMVITYRDSRCVTLIFE
jgi:hypothetical protein